MAQAPRLVGRPVLHELKDVAERFPIGEQPIDHRVHLHGRQRGALFELVGRELQEAVVADRRARSQPHHLAAEVARAETGRQVHDLSRRRGALESPAENAVTPAVPPRIALGVPCAVPVMRTTLASSAAGRTFGAGVLVLPANQPQALGAHIWIDVLFAMIEVAARGRVGAIVGEAGQPVVDGKNGGLSIFITDVE